MSKELLPPCGDELELSDGRVFTCSVLERSKGLSHDKHYSQYGFSTDGEFVAIVWFSLGETSEQEA